MIKGFNRMAKQIYVLGGGLSGIYAKLTNPDAMLIDRDDHITISTRLITLIGGMENSYAYKPRNIDLKENVKDINFENREIVTDNGKHEYSKLIIALGHSYNVNNIKGSTNIAKLETIDDAVNIRKRLQTSKNVAIIGGGYLGVEIASLINGKKVTIIDPHDRLLNHSSPEASEYVNNMLLARNVNITKGTKVMEVTGKSVITDNEEITSDLTIYAGGIYGNSIISGLPIKTKNSKILVNSKMRSLSYDDVFACGDSMAIDGKSFPATAFTGRKSAVVAMKNAMGNDIEFKYENNGNILNIDNNYIFVKKNGYGKSFMVNLIKKYVNGKTDKSLNKLARLKS